MKTDTYKKLEEAVKQFRMNVESEIETANVDAQTKALCDKITTHTEYTFQVILDTFKEL